MNRILAAAIDTAAIVVFAALGRASHSEGGAAWPTVATAAPFVAGALAGWVVAEARSRPADGLASGVVVWAAAVIGGMVIRSVVGLGTAPSFVVVAAVVLGIELIGWRLVRRVWLRRRRDHSRPMDLAVPPRV